MIGIATVPKVPLLLEEVRAHEGLCEPPKKETAILASTLVEGFWIYE